MYYLKSLARGSVILFPFMSFLLQKNLFKGIPVQQTESLIGHKVPGKTICEGSRGLSCKFIWPLFLKISMILFCHYFCHCIIAKVEVSYLCKHIVLMSQIPYITIESGYPHTSQATRFCVWGDWNSMNGSMEFGPFWHMQDRWHGLLEISLESCYTWQLHCWLDRIR